MPTSRSRRSFPSQSVLKQFPKWMCVAYAYRCCMRGLPVLKAAQPKAPPDQNKVINQVLKAAQLGMRTGQAPDSLESLVKVKLYQLRWSLGDEADINHASFTLGKNRAERCALVADCVDALGCAVLAKTPAGPAFFARYCAALLTDIPRSASNCASLLWHDNYYRQRHNLPTPKHVPAKSIDHDVSLELTIDYTEVIRTLWHDVDALSEIQQRKPLRNDHPFNESQLRDLWPLGRPARWPKVL